MEMASDAFAVSVGIAEDQNNVASSLDSGVKQSPADDATRRSENTTSSAPSTLAHDNTPPGQALSLLISSAYILCNVIEDVLLCST